MIFFFGGGGGGGGWIFFSSLLLQCKFANSTLLSLLSFSYFITPYDAQASSAFSALIVAVFVGKHASLRIRILQHKVRHERFSAREVKVSRLETLDSAILKRVQDKLNRAITR